MRLLLTFALKDEEANAANRNAKDRFQVAAAIIVDWESKKILREFFYTSPAKQFNPQHMQFAYGQLLEKHLAVVTYTEVLFVNLATWEVERIVTVPHFNDLHHLLVRGDELWVCNTGLQAVHKMTLDGRVLETFSTTETSTWTTYNPAEDYRFRDTKPHAIHPNYLFELNGDIWVTRFMTRDAVHLHDHSRRMDIGVGCCHDGCVRDGLVYFTTVTGHVVICDARTGARVRDIDLNQMQEDKVQLGWCRSINLLPDGKALVGFSQFRMSKQRQIVEWILTRGPRLPSRVVLYDLSKPAVLDEMELPDRYAFGGLFSIIQLPENVGEAKAPG
jgi:hypothetical protein